MNTSNLDYEILQSQSKFEKSSGEAGSYKKKLEGEHGKCTYIYILLYELHLDSAD